MCAAWSVENHDVGPGPRCEMADVVSLEGECSPARRRPECFINRHTHFANGEGDHDGHVGHVRRSGIAVSGQRDRDAGVEQSTRRRVRRLGGELRARQQRGHG